MTAVISVTKARLQLITSPPKLAKLFINMPCIDTFAKFCNVTVTYVITLHRSENATISKK
jgi:hypothetical protein